MSDVAGSLATIAAYGQAGSNLSHECTFARLSAGVIEATDFTAPVISDYDPAPGTPIVRTQSIKLSVTDDSGDFRRVFLVAIFAKGTSSETAELVHDGTAFRGRYKGSSRASITNGFRYTVVRTAGWPSTPTLEAYAIDEAGNEGVDL